jgi:hypothetical protein
VEPVGVVAVGVGGVFVESGGLMPLWMSSRGGRLVSALRFGLEELVDLTGDVAF